MHRPETRALQPWLTLAVTAFVFNWLWEMAQAPLYAGMLQRSPYEAVRLCTVASVGDASTVLVAYAIVALSAKDRFWAFRSASLQQKLQYGPLPMRQLALYLAVGLCSMAIMEFVNISVLHRWAYEPTMPRLFGLGVAPLIQWIIVPILILWLGRRIGSRWT